DRLPGAPAQDPGVEVRRPGHRRPEGDGRRLVDDPGRAAQAPGPGRGRVLHSPAAWRRLRALWDTVDWDADPDWEWHSAAEATPEQLRPLGQGPVPRSRSAVSEALAGGGVDQLAHYTSPDGRSPSLRRILIDMIEEYGRHVGHADLIREAVDGLVGEGPP